MLPKSFSATITNIHGNDEGCIRAESKPTIIIYRIPYSFTENLLSEAELKRPGIYFLVKESVPSIYVGQGDSHDDGSGVLKRMLGKHTEGVDDWDVAFVLVSGTPSLLGATELNWLERCFYDKAKAIGRYKVMNSVRPPGKEPGFDMRGIIDTFIELAELLLRRDLGLYAFESKKIPVTFGEGTLIGTQMVLAAPRSGVFALGVLTGYKSIYVYPGATVGENKLSDSYYKIRKKLEDDGVISEGRLATGYEFSSPTQAAAVLLGSNKSGTEAWKDKSGRTLGELQTGEPESTREDGTSVGGGEMVEPIKSRREAFKFSLADIPIGATIVFKDDITKTAIVIDDKNVEYEGKEYSLSALANLLLGREGSIQGTIYFTYEGEILDDRRKRIEAGLENEN